MYHSNGKTWWADIGTLTHSEEEDDDIILLLFVAFGVTNLLSILQKSMRQLVWVKPWLQTQVNKKCLSQHYIGTKITRSLCLPKIFLYE